MRPSRLRFIVLDSDATFLVRHRLAIIVQLDIACLEALHVALFDKRLLGAHQSTHRQCRARGLTTRTVLAVHAVHKLGLPTEADLARRLVPRSFPEVKSARYMCVCVRVVTVKENWVRRGRPYMFPDCLSDRVRYMRVAPIDLSIDLM